MWAVCTAWAAPASTRACCTWPSSPSSPAPTLREVSTDAAIVSYHNITVGQLWVYGPVSESTSGKGSYEFMALLSSWPCFSEHIRVGHLWVYGPLPFMALFQWARQGWGVMTLWPSVLHGPVSVRVGELWVYGPLSFMALLQEVNKDVTFTAFFTKWVQNMLVNKTLTLSTSEHIHFLILFLQTLNKKM